MGLTNHTWPISHHIMSLVINASEADTQTHTYQRANKNDFEKQGAHLV